MSQTIHYTIVTAARKYMFSMDLMPLCEPDLMKILPVVTMSIPTIINMKESI